MHISDLGLFTVQSGERVSQLSHCKNIYDCSSLFLSISNFPMISLVHLLFVQYVWDRVSLNSITSFIINFLQTFWMSCDSVETFEYKKKIELNGVDAVKHIWFNLPLTKDTIPNIHRSVVEHETKQQQKIVCVIVIWSIVWSCSNRRGVSLPLVFDYGSYWMFHLFSFWLSSECFTRSNL